MSYTRTYSTSVTVYGSESVHYPASEHGGYTTVNYQQTVPVDICVTVETSPFDTSVRNVGSNVDGLTASVATMNAVNCAAISENAEKISQSLIKGFYSLVNSDITMKKSENNSQLQSKAALLLELSRDIKDKHIRMSEDIERLRAHYGAIFRDLDEDLQKRIQDIDRYSFRLSEKVREDIIFKPYRTIAANTALEESTEGQQKGSISIARIRCKVSEVLNIMSDSIRKNLLYRKMMNDTLWNEYADESEQVYIPAAYFVSEGLDSKQSCDRYYVSECGSSGQIISSVSSYVNSNLASEGKDIPEEEFKLIDQAFASMVEEKFMQQDNSDKFNERVYSEILRLWHTDKPHLKQI